MNCLKCGKETVGNQVFCDECLEVMKQNPVKPGTPVQIPVRKSRTPDKKQNGRQRKLTENEQLLQYRNLIRWLTLTIAVLCAVLCLMAVMMVLQLDGKSFSDFFSNLFMSVRSPWKW